MFYLPRQYEIVDGNIDDAFAINTSSGIVSVKGDLDYETRPLYTLKIRASDKGSPRLYSEKDFIVNLVDVNDNFPVFTDEPYRGEMRVFLHRFYLLL